MNQNWSQIFCNEVALPKHFNIKALYNPNRQTVYASEMWFIEECFKAGFFDIHKYEINIAPLSDTILRQQRIEIMRLKDYSRENEFIIGSLWNLIHVIKQSGFEVVESGDSIPGYARAYVPAWKLMISPSTQSITDILHMLTQKDEKICIATSEYYGSDEKTVAYFIESKPQFHKVYKAFLREKASERAKIENL
ncbi:hypothetical protein AM499_06745 [Bacillus sp. FJAT-22090]|uniref:hypothetical protein n=1 Tax=Bacillus sp. FJAT-22090 TaxID=1581038 RepID=UPI0006ADB115|nr:hypothetical protein [Bacillus sp. FJAT-22090]ALC85550.1 hypothetical protein AM499_06745 [Bacillus sp. FJAT-22090]